VTKAATMTVRLDADLYASFMRTAARAQRPAAQIVRELMREHIRRAKVAEVVPQDSPDTFPETSPALTETRRRQREEAVKHARASVQLEGFDVPEAYRAEAERFIRGEVDFAALTAKADELAGR